MRRPVTVAAVLGFVVVAGCSSAVAGTSDPNNTHTQVAEYHEYTVFADTYSVGGRTVSCLTFNGRSLVVSCDWTAK